MLTTRQRHHFESQLTAQLREVSRRLADHLDDETQLTERADIASQSEPVKGGDLEVEEQLTSSEENLIAKITFALSRLEDGTYDQCCECGKAIPLERLEAKPSASRCVACQSRHDAR